MTSVIQIQNVLSSESTCSFSVATSNHGCLNTRGKPNLASFMFLVKRGPLNSVVPSTLLVTTTTWLLTARSTTSATSRSGGRIKAGEDGDVFLNLSFSVPFFFAVSEHLQEFNICFSASGLPIDTVRWDLCSLPIRTSSIDIIITDMPFGKR